ncbi:MAG: chromate transporter [Pseudomonadota bacterium]|nr:chromate transporter [Pseudomonadota bacterium]
MPVWVDLGMAWLRIGLFGFGGGPSVIPLIRHECVERYGWMTDAELLDALAFGNALPGPIAVKLAAHIGMQVAGAPGCLVALVALNVPSIGMMLALAAVYARYRDTPAVAGAMAGVRPAVVGLLAYTAWSLAPDGVRNVAGGLIAVATFTALVFKVHPAIVIALAMGVGAIFLR